MNKLAAGLLLMAALTSLGCGKSNTTVSTPAGTVSVQQGGGTTTITAPSATVAVQQDAKSMTVTSDKGNATITTGGGQSDAEKAIGLPSYPGATSQGAVTANDEDGQATSMNTLITSDPYDKVFTFYKEKMPGAKVTTVDANGIKTSVLVVEDEGKPTQTVTVNGQGAQTMIQIAVVHKPAGASSPSDEPSPDESP
ncbi:MAG: hypothetical protein FJX76_05435 [Armatimonadetes bacterium]|nr:hypothetical protein [Armatimonadota bacterium]